MATLRTLRTRLSDSLAVRVVALSSLWAIAAFIVVGGLISSFYRQTAEAGFEAVVRAQLFNLVNTVAVSPTIRSPSFLKPTTEGVVRAPSGLGITTASPPSITATQEFVVPKSIPITLLTVKILLD